MTIKTKQKSKTSNHVPNKANRDEITFPEYLKLKRKIKEIIKNKILNKEHIKKLSKDLNKKETFIRDIIIKTYPELDTSTPHTDKRDYSACLYKTEINTRKLRKR